jgi:hypothetical protein
MRIADKMENRKKGASAMSSVNTISSLLSQYLLNTEDSSSTDLAEILAQDSDSGITDTVSLSSASQNMLSTLLGSLSDTQAESGDSGDSLYDVLLSAENTKMVKNNPGLVKMILAVKESESSDGTTGSGTASVDDIDLFAMSSGDLLSIIEKYKALSGSTTSSTSSQIDETA